jgi:hypothetical protein
MQTSYPPIRRIVTGHDQARVARVLIDAPATNAKSPQPGLVSTMIWCTDGAPAAMPIGERFGAPMPISKQNGTTTSAVPMYSFSDFNKLIGFEDVWEFERRYAERD